MSIMRALFVTLCAVSALGMLQAPVTAGNISTILYNNVGGVGDVSAALDFNVEEIDADTVKFTFQWDSNALTQAQIDGGIRIDDFAIVDGIFVLPGSLVQQGTLSFVEKSPPQGSGELFNHPLMKNATIQIQEASTGGSSTTALDPGDVLCVTFDLKSGIDFNTVLSDIEDGTVRIGAHVISNEGNSQVYISGPQFMGGPTLPEPSSLLLLGLGGIGLLGFARRRRSQQAA